MSTMLIHGFPTLPENGNKDLGRIVAFRKRQRPERPNPQQVMPIAVEIPSHRSIEQSVSDMMDSDNMQPSSKRVRYVA